MKRRRLLIFGFSTFILLMAAALIGLPRIGINFTVLLRRAALGSLETPPGFEVSIFAEGLSGPRLIAFGPDGQLYVAERGLNQIIRLPDAGGDGKADGVEVFADQLESPNSLVFQDGSWFVGLPTGVARLTDRDGDGMADEVGMVFEHQTPGAHNTRTVLFLPDGRMLVAMGSSCNVCEELDPQRAAITIFDGPGGGGERPFATGLRNAVGLALFPGTDQVWATNNGRDLMGDNLPPETVNVLQEGGDYGWPYCHAGRIEDPDLGFPGACEGVVDPVVEMQAHSAPLGLAFYTGTMFPTAYRGDLFVAFHGSWNRSEPTGYKVVRIPLDGQAVAGPPEDFLWGFLTTGGVSGRPVGLAVGPDGALYVSDDYGGRIYRVVWAGE